MYVTNEVFFFFSPSTISFTIQYVPYDSQPLESVTNAFFFLHSFSTYLLGLILGWWMCSAIKDFLRELRTVVGSHSLLLFSFHTSVWKYAFNSEPKLSIKYADDTQFMLCFPASNSYVSAHISEWLLTGLLIMDGSSSPETKSQPHWAAENSLVMHLHAMILCSLWRALRNHTTWQCTQPCSSSYCRFRRILLFLKATKVLVQSTDTSEIGLMWLAPVVFPYVPSDPL